MIHVALLHPKVPRQAIEPFRRISPNVTFRENLELSSDLEAVLIFGGDGTVHRHLSGFHRHKVPVLIVPKGSGNDFAKALGITSEAVALRACRQCSSLWRRDACSAACRTR